MPGIELSALLRGPPAMVGSGEAFLTALHTGLPGPSGWPGKASVKDMGVGGEGVEGLGVGRE